MPDERIREGYPKRQDVSVWSWIGMFLSLKVPPALGIVAGAIWHPNLMIIVGSVILAEIILLIVYSTTARRASMRNFAIAALILVVLFTVLAVLAFAFFGGEIVTFIENLGTPVAKVLTDAPTVTPAL